MAVSSASDELEQLQAENLKLRRLLSVAASKLDFDLEAVEPDVRARDREFIELRSALAEAERQLAGIRQTFVYRIGEIIISARNLKGLRRMPRLLFALRRAFIEKRRAAKSNGLPLGGGAERLRYVDEAHAIFAARGLDAAVRYVRSRRKREAGAKARALVDLAQRVRLDEPERAAAIGVLAAHLDPAEPCLRALILSLFQQGAVLGAAEILERTGERFTSEPDRDRMHLIKAYQRQLREPVRFEARRMPNLDASKVAVICNSASMDHLGCIAYRAQAVAEAYDGAGRQVLFIAGADHRSPKGAAADIGSGTGGHVDVLSLPPIKAAPFHDFVEEMGLTLADMFASQGVAHVHAVADGPLAAAAVWAARRCGARFVFDVGAIPRFSSTIDGADDERSQADKALFIETATGADEVLGRSQRICETLKALGVVENVSRMDDAIPAEFDRLPAAEASDLRRFLGIRGQPIIGVFEPWDGDEGATDVLRALPIIHTTLPDAAILYVGSRRSAQALARLAVALDLPDHLLLPSDQDRQRLADYLSIVSVAAFPQSSTDAAPLGLQIAMGMGKPVIAPRAPWSLEWIEPGVTGLSVAQGDVDGWASAITESLTNKTLAEKLGLNGRKSVQARAAKAAIDSLVTALLTASQARAAA